MLLSSGTLLNGNRYRIEAVLGRGGFGVVYLATHLQSQVQVAIKATNETGPSIQEAFTHEARLLYGLRHPHLPRFTDFFIESPQPYLVMDYIAGHDLDQLMNEHSGPMNEADVLPWIDQVLDALTYLHRQVPPVIHRDVKPANIRLAPNNMIYLVDFGIAKVGDVTAQTQHLARAVCPPFSPPEQYGATPTDTYSDVYALGATLYYLLTAVLPPESVARQAGVELIPPRQLNPAISPDVEQIILRAMALSIHERYSQAQTIREALPLPHQRQQQWEPPSWQPLQQSCPLCHAPPLQGLTQQALFCYACGTPLVLPFPAIQRKTMDPEELLALCDLAWSDALHHLQSGLLQRWLTTYARLGYCNGLSGPFNAIPVIMMLFWRRFCVRTRRSPMV